MKDILAIISFFGGLLLILYYLVKILFFMKTLEDFANYFGKFKYGIILMTVGVILGTF